MPTETNDGWLGTCPTGACPPSPHEGWAGLSAGEAGRPGSCAAACPAPSPPFPPPSIRWPGVGPAGIPGPPGAWPNPHWSDWRLRRSLCLWTAALLTVSATAACRRLVRPPDHAAGGAALARTLSRFILVVVTLLGALLSVAGIGDGSAETAMIPLCFIGATPPPPGILHHYPQIFYVMNMK